MANVIFQIVGSTLARKIAVDWGIKSAIGQAVASAIGTLIGSAVANALFPAKVDGERFKDGLITNSSFGTPIPLVYGDENRVTGNVIWTSGLVETKHTKKVGNIFSRVKVTTYTYSVSMAVALAQGTCKNIRKIWLNKKLAFDASVYYGTRTDYEPWTVTSGLYYNTAPFYSMTFYPGNETQTADPVMQAALGAGNVPGYRGTCYIVFKDLQLADYQNSTPIVEVELEGAGGTTLYSVIDDICAKANTIGSGYTISPDLILQTVRGYVVQNSGTAMAAIEPLMAAYGFIAAEGGGLVNFKRRNTGACATIPIEQMGARAGKDSENKNYPLEIDRAPEVELPREMSVTFLDPDRDYQSNTQKAVRAFGDAASNMSVELPIVLSPEVASQIAVRGLRERWTQRATVKFTVGPEYQFLRAGDLVTVPVADSFLSVRISSLTRGDNAIIEVQAVGDDMFAFGVDSVGISAPVPDNPLRETQDSIGYLFNPPIISDEHTDSSFVAVCDNPAHRFPGAVMYSGPDDSTYTETASFSAKQIIGTCDTTLGSITSGDLWDRKNTLTVTLSNDEDNLETVTEADVLNGANYAWVGAADGLTGEIIQFQTATETSPGVFVLSNLLRGRRATEHAISTHSSSEVFVLFESWADVDSGEGGVNRYQYYKFVTAGQDPATIFGSQYKNIGEGGKCRSVAQIATTRDGSDDLTVSWLPRTRYFPVGLGYGLVDLKESESYEVDFTNFAGTTVYRTVATTSRTASYTAAEQSADGLTPGVALYGYVYQLSASRGRGHSKRFAIP